MPQNVRVQKLFYVLLFIAFCIRCYSQEKIDSIQFQKLFETGKREVSNGLLTMGVGAGFFVISRLLPDERNSGWNFAPRGRDLLVVVAVVTSSVGSIVFLSGKMKIHRARMMLEFEPFLKPQGSFGLMPALRIGVPLR